MKKKKKYIREGGICQFFDTWAKNGTINYQELGEAMRERLNQLKKQIMMTLEEAIKHCEEQAEKHCGDGCGMEHKQLAEWLIELQHYRNVWKTPPRKPKMDEIVLVQASKWFGHKMFIGKYYIDPNESDREGVFLEPSRGLIYLEDIDKWAYPEDVFPFSDGMTIVLQDYRDGESKKSSGGNRALESHKAWEESLLYADRIRGSF